MKFHRFLALLLLALLLFVGAACSTKPAAGSLQGGAPTREEATAVAELPSPTATASLPPTFTSVPTITPTRTPGPSPTASQTPTQAPPATVTAVATATPTSRPQTANRVPVFGTPYNLLTVTPSTPIPTAVPTFEVPSGVTNVLLLGSDTDLEQGVTRTDTMIIVSINRNTKTASMVSLPRDMYVFIPGWTMNRINTAMAHGSAIEYPNGGGVGQLKDTILYNFGIPIHYYARIDIDGFEKAVDAIGGVEVAVSCPVNIPVVKSREPLEIENMRLEPGMYDMDGELALWYARSRTGSSDFDRNRRQQQVLRALLNRGVDLDLLGQVPALYAAYRETVETDLDIGRILELASLAPAVRQNGVQHLFISGKQLQPWTVPENGAAVQLPVWEEMEDTFSRLSMPPALNSGMRAPIYVEILNGTDNPDLALLAADNLAYYGFVPVISEAERKDYEHTTLTYFGDNLKGSFDWLVSWIFHKRSQDIALIPDTPYQYDYQVILGSDYDPCVNQLAAPRATLP